MPWRSALFGKPPIAAWSVADRVFARRRPEPANGNFSWRRRRSCRGQLAFPFHCAQLHPCSTCRAIPSSRTVASWRNTFQDSRYPAPFQPRAFNRPDCGAASAWDPASLPGTQARCLATSYTSKSTGLTERRSQDRTVSPGTASRHELCQQQSNHNPNRQARGRRGSIHGVI